MSKGEKKLLLSKKHSRFIQTIVTNLLRDSITVSIINQTAREITFFVSS